MDKNVMPWEELLTYEKFDEYSDEFGPHTQQVANCFETLDLIPWFELSGSNVPEGYEAVGVDTWADALKPIMGGEVYRPDGLLAAPADLVDAHRKDDDNVKWLKKALDKVDGYTNYDKYIPSYLEKSEKQWLSDHIARSIEYMLLEIIASDDVESTYFRENLSWFEVGHFPCGWEGDWPDGLRRIF